MTGKWGGVVGAVLALSCGGGVTWEWDIAASGGATVTTGGGPLATETVPGSVGSTGGAIAPAVGGSGGASVPDPTGGAPGTGGLATGGLASASGGSEAVTGGAGGSVEPGGASGAAGAPLPAVGAAGVAGAPRFDGGAAGAGLVTDGGGGGSAGAGPRLDCPLPGNTCTIHEDGVYVGERCGRVPVEGCGFAQCSGCWAGEYCSLDNWCRRYDDGCVPFGEHEEAVASVVFAPVGQVVRDGSTSVGGGSICTLLACSRWPPKEQDVTTGEVLERCPVHSVEYGTYWCREDLCPVWPE